MTTLSSAAVRDILAVAHGEMRPREARARQEIRQMTTPTDIVECERTETAGADAAALLGRNPSAFRTCDGLDCGLCDECLRAKLARRERIRAELEGPMKAAGKNMTGKEARAAIKREVEARAAQQEAGGTAKTAPATKLPQPYPAHAARIRLSLMKTAKECGHCAALITPGQAAIGLSYGRKRVGEITGKLVPPTKTTDTFIHHPACWEDLPVYSTAALAGTARPAPALKEATGPAAMSAPGEAAATPAVVQSFPGAEQLIRTRISRTAAVCAQCDGVIPVGSLHEAITGSLEKASALVGRALPQGSNRFHQGCLREGSTSDVTAYVEADPSTAPTVDAAAADGAGAAALDPQDAPAAETVSA